MSNEYTPTTDEVRKFYIKGEGGLFADEEFDRWLTDRDRQARRGAWGEGHEQGYDSGRYSEDDNEPETLEGRSLEKNPYRASTEQSGANRG